MSERLTAPVDGKIGDMLDSPRDPIVAGVPAVVLDAFEIDASTAFRRSGDVHLTAGAVLKPVSYEAEARWCADLFDTLEVAQVRLPRPLRTATGAAVVRGWCGWERVAGHTDPGRWTDVLDVAARLHGSLADHGPPPWMDTKDDLWRDADRYAWDEAALTMTDDPSTHRLQPLLAQLRGLRVQERRPSPAQVVHIDLLGNVLFADRLAPAVIDPTFYWRPAGYADAVVAVDAAAWTTAGAAPLEHLAARGDLDLLVRAARFRVARDLLGPEVSADRVVAHHRVVTWLLELDDHHHPEARR